MAAAGFLLYYNRQVIKKLKKSGATSPDNARTLEEAGITAREARSIGRLELVGKIHEVTDKEGNKRYYVTQ